MNSIFVLFAILGLGLVALGSFAFVLPGPARKFWHAAAAQLNKAADKVQSLDPIAQMKREIDQKADALKDGRLGLEKHRGMLEHVKHDEEEAQAYVRDTQAKLKSYLATGTADDRETAAQLALELEKAEASLAKVSARVKLQQATYDNNLEKLKYATRQVGELRDRVAARDADLRFSRVEKEIAHLGEALKFDVGSPTNLGEIERVIQAEIDQNRAAAQVAADLSGTGLDAIRRDLNTEKQRAELALQAFEAKQLTASAPVVEPAATPAPLSEAAVRQNIRNLADAAARG